MNTNVKTPSNLTQMPPDPDLLENAAKKHPWTCCTACGKELFIQAVQFKILSPLQVGGSSEVVVARNVWACQQCGEINGRIPAPQGGQPR